MYKNFLSSSDDRNESGEELDEIEAVPLGIVMTLTLNLRFARVVSSLCCCSCD